jgi:biopolymer transport protein ExbD
MDTPEIDVTPIMNMFIILIPFLVSMAVFTHLAVLRMSLPPNVGAGLAGSDDTPKVKMTMVVAPEYLAITHGDKMLDSIPVVDGEYDLAAFAARLDKWRAIPDCSDEAIVAVRDKVRFKHVVHVMDACRKAGFAKLGLSNATEDAARGV